jgi:membrane-bound lytic murein transglycosylase B
MARRGRFAAILAACVAASTSQAVPAWAQSAPVIPFTPEDQAKFQAFIENFRAEALLAGIAPETYDRAMMGLSPDPRVEALNLAQPEFVRPVWEYLAGAVSEQRIAQGRALIAANADLFQRLEATYGVPREVLTAIWGLESAYGASIGTFNLFDALATLAFEGPRADYGKRQLIAALKILQAEDRDPATMVGSWAGAFGLTQFAPTTFLDYAVDGNGDGKRDLWDTPADALASTANYLQHSGWRMGESWGEEVSLAPNFPYEEADLDNRKSYAEWAMLGVTRADGAPLVQSSDEAALFLPAGYRGPAFLVGANFNVILKYNFATSYALAIGLLSDALKGAQGVTGSWPTDEAPLSLADRVTLQQGLSALGYDTGEADGVLGRQTRGALRAFQKARGLPADGFATSQILTRVLNERALKR